MTVRAQGVGSDISFARQSSFGSGLTPTHTTEIISESLRLERIPGISESTRGVTERRHFLDKEFVQGSFIAELMYEGYDLFYQNLFGSVADSQVEVGAHQHVFDLVDAVLEPGLTLSVDRDLSSNRAYDSCTMAKATFRADIGKILRMTPEVIGRVETDVAVPSKVYPAENPILHSQMVAEINDASFDVRSFEVTIDDARDSDRRKLGSAFIKEPSRTGHRIITGVVEVELEAYTNYDLYVAGTPVKLELICTGGIIGATSTNFLWHLTLPECLMTGETPNVGGPGPIIQRYVFKAMYDIGGVVDAATLTTRNANQTT